MRSRKSYSVNSRLQLDCRVAGVDGHTSAAWVGEPPVRKIWGLVALDPSHPILILSRNAARAQGKQTRRAPTAGWSASVCVALG